MTTDLVQPEMWMISSHLRPRLGWKSGGVMTPTTLDISTDEKIEESSESPSPRHPPDLEQSGDLFYGTDLTDAEEGDQGLAAAAAEMFVTEWRCAAAAKACSKASRPTCAAMCPCIYILLLLYNIQSRRGVVVAGSKWPRHCAHWRGEHQLFFSCTWRKAALPT
jgi:hypothetical protein